MDDDLKSIAAARRCAETAFTAYRQFLGTDPEQVNAIVDAMAQAIVPEAARLGRLAAEETGYGNAAHKRIKDLFNAVEVSKFLSDVTTLGVLWRDDKTKIAAIGEPMGVVAALIPVTNPTSTTIFKILSAVKSGNAIVCAPHPRGVRCGREVVRIMAGVAEQMGAPKGLIQCLDNVTLEGTAALMQHRRTSVVMATGGTAMVRAAYSSGKPTLAVGPGNVPCYVHQSKRGEIGEVAEQVITSKSFDYGTACISEDSIVADRGIARELRQEMRLRGAYFCTSAEAERLAGVMFRNRAIDPDNVGQAPAVLAERAEFSIPPGTRVLVAEESDVGWDRPLSAEKLGPVLTFYEARDFDHGMRVSESVVDFGGWGHSAAMHADDPQAVARFSNLPVGRVIVNTPALLGGMGYSTDIEPSFMLGTGTWSGSITSDNVTALHLINIKRVAYGMRPWRDLFEEYGE